jgi:SAM-dependent methyltransferase
MKFNRILDNSARRELAASVARLGDLCPAMIARKIPEANVQQAFVFEAVRRFAAPIPSPRILCVGSFEDTASAALKASGLPIIEIDPQINYDLDRYYRRWFTKKASFDIVFSTSVIEHVRDDERFLQQIVGLLKPGGVAVLTCDFNDQYQPGHPLPREDVRFYTQRDFKVRLKPVLAGCSLVDEPQWDCTAPDFSYGGCNYTFATLVFHKDHCPPQTAPKTPALRAG